MLSFIDILYLQANYSSNLKQVQHIIKNYDIVHNDVTLYSLVLTTIYMYVLFT